MTGKLLKIQEKLKAPKGQKNTFGNYRYRSCEDILEAVKPLLVKEGLTLTLSDDIVHMGGRNYIQAKASITDGEKEISVTAYAREADSRKGMDDSQITGATSSYARKYALNGLFLIDDTKDADTDEFRKNVKEGLSKDELAVHFQACDNIPQLENTYKKYKKDVEALSAGESKAIKALVTQIKESIERGVE
jgi:hypothetical protein